MAENAKQLFEDIHNPALNGERPAMKKVPGGRPSLDSYLEPEEQEEIAVDAGRIQENYPFFGTLLKQENGIYRRKEVITRLSPKTIEEIEQIYGGGKYQVRLKREDGSEEQIHFSIPEKEHPAPSTQHPATSTQFIESIRRDAKDEARQDFEQLIDTLERRLTAKDGELDDLTGKVRRLTMELTETERQSNSHVRNEASAYQVKIEELKEEIQKLKFENFELQQDLKYADVDAGFDFKEILKDALNNPDLAKLVAPLIDKFAPQQPLALADPGNQQPATSTQHPKTSTQDMQQIINQFFTTVVKTVSSSMLSGTPGPEVVHKTIQDGLTGLRNKGIKAEPGMWVQISKKLIDVALQNSVSAQKAAETISPILSQVNGAADQLKYITPAMAAEYIMNRFGIQATDPQKKFLTEVLKVFKSQLKQPATSTQQQEPDANI